MRSAGFADDRHTIDFVMEFGGKTVGDRRPCWVGRLEILAVEILELSRMSWVPDEVAGLDDVGEIASRIFQDAREILDRASELFLERAGNDLAGCVHRRLAGDKNEIANPDGRTERQMGNGCVGRARVFD